MQTLERNIYFNFTKSIVEGFDEFVTDVEKHGGIIGDNELRLKLRHISKTLQTIFNKWQNTPDKKCTNSAPPEAVCNETESKFKALGKSDSLNDFESIVATTVGDKEHVQKVNTTEVSSTSGKSEFSIFDHKTTSSIKEVEIPESLPSCNNATTLTRKEAEIVRRFKLENVREEWIRGRKGFYVAESSRGSWKCIPCGKEPLSNANIISHASGKAHIKNVVIYTRKTSETRLKNSDRSLNSDSNLDLSDVELELVKRASDPGIIVPYNGYYCNACRGTFNTKEDI